MRISDWSSDVCSSDLSRACHAKRIPLPATTRQQAAGSSHPSPQKEGEGNYSLRLLAARNADDAGPGHFDQADVTHQVDERIYLLRPASNLKNEAVDRRVDDAGAIDIGKAERLNPLIAMTCDLHKRKQIGRASCRERVCQYV